MYFVSEGDNLEKWATSRGPRRPTYLFIWDESDPSFLRMEMRVALWLRAMKVPPRSMWCNWLAVCRRALTYWPATSIQPIGNQANRNRLRHQSLCAFPKLHDPNRHRWNWSEKTWFAGDGGWRGASLKMEALYYFVRTKLSTTTSPSAMRRYCAPIGNIQLDRQKI